MSSDTIALIIVGAFVVSSITSYIMGRKQAFKVGFDLGWKRCEDFFVKEVIKSEEIRRMNS